MEIIQIVGYKNSGKTTLATKIIETGTKEGFAVASLKHHGHGGVPVGITDTDSDKHRRAGALIAGVEGDGMLQLTCKDGWTLEKILAMYELFELELLVVEGYKTYPFPKVVLINREQDLSLLTQVNNIKAILTSIPIDERSYPYPIFDCTNIDLFSSWLVHHTVGEKKDNLRVHR